MSSSKPRKATAPTRPIGSTAAGPDSSGRARPTIRAAAIPASRSQNSRRSARRSPPCRQVFTCIARSTGSSTAAASRSRPAPISTGRPARRWRSARCCSKVTRCGCPARTPSAARSRSAIRCCTTRRTTIVTRRSPIWAKARPASKSSIQCSRKRPCSASSTVIRLPSPIRSLCGKPSSAISPTARRSCSTSSSRRANANGCACRGWFVCCRTVTKGRDRSILRPASSAFCRCAPRTTCRSPTAPRRRTIFTSCAGSSTATSASR